MGSYEETLQCHFKSPVALIDTFTFQDRNDAILFRKIFVYLRTLSYFEIFFDDILKKDKRLID